MDNLGLLFVGVVAMVGIVAWCLCAAWRARLRGEVPAALAADGAQEITIVVRNGYHPDRIRVCAGVPVRLVFDRREDDPCSGRVFFAEPRIDRALTPYASTVVAFTPNRVGIHLFTCEEGRFRGHLVVTSPIAGRPSFAGRWGLLGKEPLR